MNGIGLPCPADPGTMPTDGSRSRLATIARARFIRIQDTK
jgi:hypothetical protein